MPPANDDFLNAQSLPRTSGQEGFSTVGATTEVNESGHARTVWFTWVAPSNGTFVVDTTSTPLPWWDTGIVVYTTSGFTGPGGQTIAVNQTTQVASGVDALQPGTSGYGTERCTVSVIGGVRYYIQIAAYDDAGPDQRADGVLTYSFVSDGTGKVVFGGNYEISNRDAHHNALSKSADLETWVPATNASTQFRLIRANGPRWLGVDFNSGMWVSDDGYNWDAVVVPFFNIIDVQWSSDQSQWIVVSQGLFNPPIATSPDGRHWTLRSLGALIDAHIVITGMAFHDQTIVIVGSNDDTFINGADLFLDRFFNFTAVSYDAGVTWHIGSIAYDYVNYLRPEDAIMNSTTNRWQNNGNSPANFTGVSTSLTGGHNGTGYVQITDPAQLSLICMTHSNDFRISTGYRYYVPLGHPIDPANLLSTADDPYFTTTIEMWVMVNRPMNIDTFADFATSDRTYSTSPLVDSLAPANTWLKIHMEAPGGQARDGNSLLFGLDADNDQMAGDWLRVSDVSVSTHIPITQINNVAWANGAWVMGCKSWGSVIYRSIDGLRWKAVPGTMLDGTSLTNEPLSGPGAVRASVDRLCGSDNEFIAIGQPMPNDSHTQCFMRSTDGLTWTPITTPWVVNKAISSYHQFNVQSSDLVFINDQFVIASLGNPFFNGSVAPWLMGSSDGGRTWTELAHSFLTAAFPASPGAYSITYGQTRISQFSLDGVPDKTGVNFN